MAKVWDKGKGDKLDSLVEAYEVGVDYQLDGKLFKYELAASSAHALMLKKIGILTVDEADKLNKRIKELFAKYGDTIQLELKDEDIHSKLENLLIESVGEVGKKLHTGRSRNDQVAVVTRLFEKNELIHIANQYVEFIRELTDFSAEEGHKILPGYTHTKQAMLATVGMWAGAFIESGLQNLENLEAIMKMIDRNPLGTASGFGVPLALDRDMTSELLGFGQTQNNPMFAQNSRGKFESMFVDGLWAVMHDFSRMASDLIMYNMDEFLYVETTNAVTTGSSIMPQKRNFDILELVRAKTNLMFSYSNILKTLTTGLISGYHRDLQETKEPLFKAIELIKDTIGVMRVVIQNIRFDEDAVKRNLTPGIFATDIAFKAVAEGMPFRDAYRKAAEEISSIEVNDETIRTSIDERVSPGAPVTFDADSYRDSIKAVMSEWDVLNDKMNAVFDNLLK